jgi:glycosyltransferase involved in cell wall biosynthesis
MSAELSVPRGMLPKKLLILNYSMDEADRIFSHQQQIVTGLGSYWGEIHVITGKVGKYNSLPNVFVHNSSWVPGERFGSVFRFLRIFLRVTRQNDFYAIFSHMTEVQSFLIAPYCRVMKFRHYLWYAHASRSKYLKFVVFFANKIITSTPGSCPITGGKVLAIGQSVNEEQFKFINRKNRALLNFVHFGRLDKSKGIQEIIDLSSKIRIERPGLTLTLIGNPSNAENQEWADDLRNRYASESNWVKFVAGANRNELPELIGRFDIMLHAFQGSLDKTLIEATMLGIPVATLNREYLKEFGCWITESNSNSLESELLTLLDLDFDLLKSRLESRRALAVKNHSFDTWIVKLNRVLLG